MVARIKRWLEGAKVPYTGKSAEGFATFAFVCFDSQTERDAGLAQMKESIGLQVLCDGGYVRGEGAAAFVITAVTEFGGCLTSKTIGVH